MDGQPARGSAGAARARQRGGHGAGVSQVETFARQGDAADAILDVAEEQRADLIVVGNRGMTGAKRFLLGSVPNKVSHHAPCSVLIVRTTWRPGLSARAAVAADRRWPRRRRAGRSRIRGSGSPSRRAVASLEPRQDLVGRRVAAEHAAGDHQRGAAGDVGRRHRGAVPAARETERRWAASKNVSWKMSGRCGRGGSWDPLSRSASSPPPGATRSRPAPPLE